MKAIAHLLFAALVLLPGAGKLRGQTLVGQLVAAEDGQPVAGGFVILLDSAGNRHAAAISDATGRFTLRAPAPGRYSLSAERIGFENVASPAIDIGAGTTVYRFEVRARAVQLSAVEVRSRGRGCERRADSPEVYALWNEIRKALRMAAWTERSRGTSFQYMAWDRTLEPHMGVLRSESRDFRGAHGALPFAAPPADELAANGYVRRGDDGYTLYGPDAEVLLSDAFLEGHCFAMVEGPDPESVGLGFTPLARGGPPGVRGVLWVDRRSSELRRLTFDYVNLPGAADEASGVVDFTRLDDGAWFVQRWWIRSSKLLVVDHTDGSGRRTRTASRTGVRELGGAVTQAAVPGAQPITFAGTGVIAGHVADKLTGNGTGGVLVFATASPHEAVTDTAGRFRIEGVPAGRHAVAVRHPALTELALPMPLDSVDVRAGEVTRLDLHVPHMETLLDTLCPGEPFERAPQMNGLVWGLVLDGESGAPLAGVDVRADWTGPGAAGGAGPDQARWRSARTAADGRFLLCWLPTSRPAHLRVRMGRRWVEESVVELDGTVPPIRRHYFFVAPDR